MIDATNRRARAHLKAPLPERTHSHHSVKHSVNHCVVTLCSHSHSTAINWNTFWLCGTQCVHTVNHSLITVWGPHCDQTVSHSVGTLCHRVKRCSNLSQWNDYVNTVWCTLWATVCFIWCSQCELWWWPRCDSPHSPPHCDIHHILHHTVVFTIYSTTLWYLPQSTS